jgi:hypothetical protein
MLTTILELLGIAAVVAGVALSPVPWAAFIVGGVGVILVSRGLTRGGTE